MMLKEAILRLLCKMRISVDQIKFNAYDKGQYLEAAKELHYPKEVLERLRAAKSPLECERIMISARNKYL